MGAPNRNQHWVPQFYLKAFATPETRDTELPKLWAFPKADGDPFMTSVRNVAAERDLYVSRDTRVDAELTNLEAFLGGYWPKISSTDYVLDEGFRKGIGLFIATLYLRHPAVRDDHVRMRDRLAAIRSKHGTLENGQSVIRTIKTENHLLKFPPGELDRWADMTEAEVLAEWHKTILTEAGSVAEHLLSLPWTAVVTTEPAFITSDRPVILRNPRLKFPTIFDPYTNIMLPLSPTKLITINQRNAEDGAVKLIEHGKHAVFNLESFFNAYKYVFSPWHSDEMCEQILSFGDWAEAEQQRLRNAAKPRFNRRVGRNERCPCGSGVKFKRCCGQ